MGSRVQYRDLPGGPTELTFCDELTRHTLCTNCNMLSMSMLQDTNLHMFCETCLNETSEKHHRERIYCKYENKEVSIFEMFDAHALITVIRDQYVMCPYQDCKSVVTLVQLKDHYMARHPTVTCSTCKQQVQTAEWSNHSKDCRERGAYKTPPKAAIPKKGNHNGASQPKDALLSPNSTHSAKMDGYQNSGDTFRPMYPSSELQQAQKPTNDGSDKVKLCQYCEKRVKERNLPQHLMACPKAPRPCAYCQKEFSKENIQSHLAVCKANPNNIREQAKERNREAPNQNVARTSEAHSSQRDSYAAAVKGKNRVGGNISHSTTSGSGGTEQKAARQVGPASAKGASKSCPVSKQGEVPADSPVWLQYLSSGDLLTAFAAFQESFSGKNKDENFLYSEFTTKFVNTSCQERVKDLLEEPCRKHPLDCLMVGLFARVSLPPKVWAKNTHEVTWNDVLDYLPFVLVSRLKKKTVMAYLRKYPVFFGEAGTGRVVATSSGTEEHPHKDSHCRNSTNPAALPSDVADPPVNPKDGPDAPDVVKGNDLDGGHVRGVERPPVHGGEKSLPQPVPKAEVDVSERERCHDGKKHPKGVSTTRGKKAGPLLKYTQKEPTSDQLQQATDQARFPAAPSRLDTEPSCQENAVNIFNPPQNKACKLDPTHEQLGLEELGAQVTLEGHSKSDVNSLNCETYGSDLTSFGSADEGDFSHTAAKKETAPKAESASTSLDNSALKDGGELLLRFQSQNDRNLNITREDSEHSTEHSTFNSLSSAAEGTMQTHNFSDSAHAVYPIEAAVLHVDRYDTTGCQIPSTKNEPFLEHEQQTPSGRSESITPEKAPESTKYSVHRNEATSCGSRDENDFLHDATDMAKAFEARNTSSFARGNALIEGSAPLPPWLQFLSGHTQNMASKEIELSTLLKTNFRFSSEGTSQADGLSNGAHVISPTKADALPVQKTGRTEHKRPYTNWERFSELTGQARTVQSSFVSDSAPITVNEMSQYSRYEGTNTGSVSTLIAAFEASAPELQGLQARSESVASINNVTLKEEVPSDAESEQYFPGSTRDWEDYVVSQLSRLSISHKSRDERTPLTSDQSTSSQLCQRVPLQGEPYHAGDRLTEARAPPESLEEPLSCNTRCCRHRRSNSHCWTTPF